MDSIRLARRAVTRSVATVAVTLLAACGDQRVVTPGAVERDSKIPLASLDDATMMVRTPSAERGERGGTTLQLDAVLQRRNGKLLDHDKHTQWLSRDPMIATVDTAGLVTAEDVGEVWVLVSYKGTVDSVLITVVPVPVKSLTLEGPDSLSVGDDAAYIATPRDSVGDPLEGRTITWGSSTPTVASISNTGSALALAVGTTTISADCEGEGASIALRVWLAPVASIAVDPAVVNVAQFHKVKFTATLRDRHGNVLTDRPVTWASSAPSVFYIKSNADTAAGKDLGEATVTATSEGKQGTAEVTVTNPVEARALWITRFEYTGPSSVDFAKIATIMQKAASANFNIVYFQARTSGDALYFSDLEPCSPRMCGSLGGPRPAKDPLEVALTEAAKYGIEVHAWLNAYTGFIAGSSTACNQFITSNPLNWLKAHPEWSASTKNFTTGVLTRQVDNCLTTSEYMWISPGVPQVRAQLAKVAADIARRYGPKGLRGIHLDRIRYSANNVSYDQPSQDAFKAATGAFPTSNAQPAWLDFRRGFVNQGVKDVADSARAVDPSFVISAAVFPGYKSRAGWSATWSFSDLFQDPQAWAQAGSLDIEVPMNYPATAASTSWTVKAYCSNTDWTCVLDDHIARIEGQAGRQVYVGVAGIKGWTEMQKQIDLAHDRTATGMSVYSFSLVDAIPNAWSMLAAGPFKHKATIPLMPWKE
jgi:uncharacterized lipoprotein YddW (UPF0748 family)